MTTPITDNWIAEHEAICAKATEGPWGWSDFTVDQNKGGTTYTCYVHDSSDETEIAAFGLGSRMVRHGAEEDDPDWEAEVQARDNATFAASARTALPLALAELRRLREIVERLPTTADGVPIALGMNLWLEGGMLTSEGVGVLSITDPDHRHPDDYPVGERWCITVRDGCGDELTVWNGQCYSTREAALAARERGECINCKRPQTNCIC